MKKVIIEPDGWACTLGECPPGLFVYEGEVCLKTSYRTDKGQMEVYCDNGDSFSGGTVGEEKKANLMVQPVRVSTIKEE